MASPAPVAIIGMGCRFPGGVTSPEKLWEMLSEGRSGWGEIPPDRWNAESFYHPHQEAKEALNAKSGYFLNQDIAAFDAKFFNCSHYEAHTMDPQQRILLETTYEALENAGITLENVKGSDTSVFVGVYARDYDRMGYKDLPQITKLHITGTGEAVISNRISYVFDLKGASMTIDTGCVSYSPPLLTTALLGHANIFFPVWKYGCFAPGVSGPESKRVTYGARWRHRVIATPRSVSSNERRRVS